MQPDEPAEPRARPVLACCALCVVVGDVLLRNLWWLQMCHGKDEDQTPGVLGELARWLEVHFTRDTLIWVERILDFLAIPAFVLFLLFLGPKLPRGGLGRALLFAASGAVASLFLVMQSAELFQRVFSPWGCILPDLLASSAFYLASTAVLASIITVDDRMHPVGVILRLLIGLYIVAPVILVCGWVVFEIVGGLLFAPYGAWYSEVFNLVFAVAFVTAVMLVGRVLMRRWKWQSVGAILGCIIVAHGMLKGGGVYFYLFG